MGTRIAWKNGTTYPISNSRKYKTWPSTMKLLASPLVFPWWLIGIVRLTNVVLQVLASLVSPGYPYFLNHFVFIIFHTVNCYPMLSLLFKSFIYHFSSLKPCFLVITSCTEEDACFSPTCEAVPLSICFASQRCVLVPSRTMRPATAARAAGVVSCLRQHVETSQIGTFHTQLLGTNVAMLPAKTTRKLEACFGGVVLCRAVWSRMPLLFPLQFQRTSRCAVHGVGCGPYTIKPQILGIHHGAMLWSNSSMQSWGLAWAASKVRYIKDMNVYMVTALISLFAYVWLGASGMKLRKRARQMFEKASLAKKRRFNVGTCIHRKLTCPLSKLGHVTNRNGPSGLKHR